VGFISKIIDTSPGFFEIAYSISNECNSLFFLCKGDCNKININKINKITINRFKKQMQFTSYTCKLINKYRLCFNNSINKYNQKIYLDKIFKIISIFPKKKFVLFIYELDHIIIEKCTN